MLSEFLKTLPWIRQVDLRAAAVHRNYKAELVVEA